MNDCDSVNNSLVLYAEGQLDPAQVGQVNQHLTACAQCRDAIAEIRTVRGWLADPDLFVPEQTYAWQMLPSNVVARARELPAEKSWLPSKLGSLGWAAGLAATFLLACGLVWMFYRQAPEPPVAAKLAAPGNEAFLGRIHLAYVREATAQYLSECQDLLINVVRAGPGCRDQKYDVSVEVERARALLQRKRLLDPELRAPEVVRAKQVCDELETFLLNLSTSESCETRDKLRRMENYIQQQQLLLRISVLRSELS